MVGLLNYVSLLGRCYFVTKYHLMWEKKKALISLPAKILNLKSQITLNPVLFFYLPCEWAVKANVGLCHLMLLSLPYTDPVDKYVSLWWCFY